MKIPVSNLKSLGDIQWMKSWLQETDESLVLHRLKT